MHFLNTLLQFTTMALISSELLTLLEVNHPACCWFAFVSIMGQGLLVEAFPGLKCAGLQVHGCVIANCCTLPRPPLLLHTLRMADCNILHGSRFVQLLLALPSLRVSRTLPPYIAFMRVFGPSVQGGNCFWRPQACVIYCAFLSQSCALTTASLPGY